MNCRLSSKYKYPPTQAMPPTPTSKQQHLPSSPGWGQGSVLLLNNWRHYSKIKDTLTKKRKSGPRLAAQRAAWRSPPAPLKLQVSQIRPGGQKRAKQQQPQQKYWLCLTLHSCFLLRMTCLIPSSQPSGGRRNVIGEEAGACRREETWPQSHSHF